MVPPFAPVRNWPTPCLAPTSCSTPATTRPPWRTTFPWSRRHRLPSRLPSTGLPCLPSPAVTPPTLDRPQWPPDGVGPPIPLLPWPRSCSTPIWRSLTILCASSFTEAPRSPAESSALPQWTRSPRARVIPAVLWPWTANWLVLPLSFMPRAVRRMHLLVSLASPVTWIGSRPSQEYMLRGNSVWLILINHICKTKWPIVLPFKSGRVINFNIGQFIKHSLYLLINWYSIFRKKNCWKSLY